MRFIALLACFAAATAVADDVSSPYGKRPIDFSLRFSQHDFDLDYGGGTRIDTSVDRLTATFRERYGERVWLGLSGGYAYLTQTGNSATSGRELNGYFGGLSLELELFRTGRMDGFLHAEYVYQKVDHEDGTQEVVIVTKEPKARLGMGLSLGKSFRIHGGVRAGRVDGEQRLRGSVNQTLSVEETRDTGGFGALELTLDKDGYVGIAVESGSDRSAAIYFGRRF